MIIYLNVFIKIKKPNNINIKKKIIKKIIDIVIKYNVFYISLIILIISKNGDINRIDFQYILNGDIEIYLNDKNLYTIIEKKTY